jgi:hypothetical protein
MKMVGARANGRFSVDLAQMTLISTVWIWEYGPFAAREGLPEPCWGGCFKGQMGNIKNNTRGFAITVEGEKS